MPAAPLEIVTVSQQVAQQSPPNGSPTGGPPEPTISAKPVVTRATPATTASSVAQRPSAVSTTLHQIQAAPSARPAAATAAVNPHVQVRTRKETLEAKRERKAAKTLAIITGAFVVCWLPFFIMVMVSITCPSCVIDDDLAALFLWLGYFNSTLNPVIYTIFSPEFRQAFKRLLCGKPHRGGTYYRGGKL